MCVRLHGSELYDRLVCKSYSASFNLDHNMNISKPKKIAPCSSSPCVNGGTCSNITSEPYYNCACPGDYTGLRCQIGMWLFFFTLKVEFVLFINFISTKIRSVSYEWYV